MFVHKRTTRGSRMNETIEKGRAFIRYLLPNTAFIDELGLKEL
jgi:hypothetical protein